MDGVGGRHGRELVEAVGEDEEGFGVVFADHMAVILSLKREGAVVEDVGQCSERLAVEDGGVLVDEREELVLRIKELLHALRGVELAEDTDHDLVRLIADTGVLEGVREQARTVKTRRVHGNLQGGTVHISNMQLFFHSHIINTRVFK